MSGDQSTETLKRLRESSTSCVRLTVLAGPDQGLTVSGRRERLTVGTAEGVSLRLTDPTVSRYHLELEPEGRGILLRDLDSTNGTLLSGVLVREAVIQSDREVTLGATRIGLNVSSEPITEPPPGMQAFGRLMGSSSAIRSVFRSLELAASTTVPILITGESGTGKELAARAVHLASPRAKLPFEVVDCGGLPPTLIESELFGYERGAFTGAVSEREGALERADGGTLFLDELGELPLELQPKLLRALGEGEVRRLGGRRVRKLDVRVVAATNRDLRREVNQGRFRADLFYRLAVVQVKMPSLRERLDDLPVLVTALLDQIRSDRKIDTDVDLNEEFWASLSHHSWPGNIRELRNHLEQLMILQSMPTLGGEGGSQALGGSVESEAAQDFTGLESLPLRNAKAQLIERFERYYVTRVLSESGGNVTEAARRAGIDRVTLFRTMRRYGLQNPR